ncbi:MAG: hypothetical protein GY730_05590 [bacterium]|nr:hypothetical protein [bacterium]
MWNIKKASFELIDLKNKTLKEKEKLVKICCKVAFDSKLPVDEKYYNKHIHLPAAFMVLVQIEGKAIAVYLFHRMVVNGKKCIFNSLASVVSELNGKGISSKVSLIVLKYTIPDFCIGRTANPLVYFTVARMADKVGTIYPDFINKIPEKIMKIARKLPGFINRDGPDIADDFILKNYYEPEFAQKYLKQNLKGNNQRVKRINEHFLHGPLKKRDAQIIIIQLNFAAKIFLYILKLAHLVSRKPLSLLTIQPGVKAS